MLRLTLALILIVTLGGCVSKHIHQGNVINEDSAWIIQEGDTRFSIESELGTPSIQDDAHPERALYIEEFFDEDLQESYTRSIEIMYDQAWRAKSITRLGFK